MRALFVSTGLAMGGAERQLVRLAGELHQAEWQLLVLSLREGAVADDIRALDIPVMELGLEKEWGITAAARRLVAEARTFRPDIIQGWMYHGNLAATIARRFAAPRAKLIWGVRQSLYDLRREKPLTQHAIRASAWASRAAQAIVYNSHTARTQHETFGFKAGCGRVIDNGFDVTVFRPSAECRHAVRAMLGLASDTLLIGQIARFHPMKGHRLFLEAAVRLSEIRRDVHFVLVGREVLTDNPMLSKALGHPALAGRVHCLGERKDMARLTAGLDIASSTSSWGESFPNAVGEAMCCSVPVVTSDVGDVQRIVGDAGIIVPAGDIEGLAAAWARLLDDSELRFQLGQFGRQRVLNYFSVEAMGRRYLELYEELLHA